MSKSAAGSLRQRPDGRWEARYTVGRHPGTGKPIRKSIYGDTQKEVRQALTQALRDIDTGVYIEPSKLTVSQWLDIWLSEYMGDKKYLTVKHYRAQVETHIKPALGAVKLDALTPPMIQKFYNELLHEGKGGQPLSPKSVRNIHGILTKSLSVAVSIGYLRSNPAASATLPRVEPKEMHPITGEEVQAFLKLCDTDKYGDMFKVILFTGLREGEALGLTWDCVGFSAGTIKVYRQLQKRPMNAGGFTYAALKNDKTRIIKPAPFVFNLLRTVRAEQAACRLASGIAWTGWQNEKERGTAPIFTNEQGAHLEPRTVVKHFKKLVTQLDRPDVRVHDLRHSYAMLALQNGDDVKTVQHNLGHATAAFTLDVYGHVSEQMKQASAERMERYIQSLIACKN